MGSSTVKSWSNSDVNATHAMREGQKKEAAAWASAKAAILAKAKKAEGGDDDRPRDDHGRFAAK